MISSFAIFTSEFTTKQWKKDYLWIPRDSIYARIVRFKFRTNGTTLNGTVSFECVDSFSCEIVHPYNGSTTIDIGKLNSYTNIVNVTISALYVGLNQLKVVLNRELDSIEYYYDLRLLRPENESKLAQIFTSSATVFVICITFMMGTQLKLEYLMQIIKAPVGPVIGFVCQFTIMPVIGYLLAKFVIPEGQNPLKFALFAISCSPGGGKSSFWTIIYNGNLDMSILITFSQLICALFMMPIWIYTVGQEFATARVNVPIYGLLQSFAILIIPTACGMIFINYWPDLVKIFNKWIKIVSWISMAVFTFFLIYTNMYVISLVSWPIVLSACALPWSGYVIAYFVSLLFCQAYRERITIAIETGVQNTGITFLMLMYSLEEPELDLALVMPIAVILVTDKPLLILYIIRWIWNKCRGDEQDLVPKTGSKENVAQKDLYTIKVGPPTIIQENSEKS
ncbi:sodium bile acid symporter family domain-containing protein [Ditylenchus destructor]|uniref:Sodium bile acid symporter family domain-containing protein n=1 Tax=Ditylenchus destructor TaxID=166010 RepID=A0AAD4R9V0_9BILA|nr:sodium bile acid symporter family domain-containing protein [Ditylenchus destructor]